MIVQCLTSIVTDAANYIDVEAQMVAKYGKHPCKIMWKIFEWGQGENETAEKISDCIELLKT